MATLHSSHIFMFPFRFDWNEQGFSKEYDFYKSNDIANRIALKNLNTQLEQKGWECKPFKIENAYSEYAYFYDYARDAIYNLDDFSETAISNYYEKNDFNGKIFELNIQKKGSGNYITEASSYKLQITGLSLRVFNSGVAILSLELANHEYDKLSDILRINDYGRRVYPQFIGERGIANTKKTFLADSIKIIGSDIVENFEYDKFDDTYIGTHILDILSQDIFTQKRDETNKYYIQPSLDDRMFVISWYGNDKLSAEPYSKSDDWYRYVFVDNGMVTVQNKRMKKELLKNATYDRWSNFGTLFGVTRYSFTLLSPSKKSLEKENAEMIIEHTQTMYFQMITLLLATRTSILRFSDEIAALASSETLETEKLTTLYQRYLTFYNRLYFKEVTHQDQGIELYDMARKQMKIDEHMEKLDGKFTKLFEFAKMQSDDANGAKMDKLTVMGAIFLPPSLMIALFSMGIFDYAQSEKSLFIAVIAMVISAILTIGFINFKEEAKKLKGFILPAIIITVVTLSLVLGSIKLIGEKESKAIEVKVVKQTSDKNRGQDE